MKQAPKSQAQAAAPKQRFMLHSKIHGVIRVDQENRLLPAAKK
ncbi:MAG TPA: hypothetical protein P5186_19145 [Candidatus Paceibacterota bacterium]|nr:hypothetical protein [Verrucomicrobiota bacterium]HRY50173.1 hypothetical protein [Candidatus Paceibacterota bacterium]